ncbi:MAG: 1-aminocyclopropane-1-carboxylate deaminase/D-cysteine desulfhydrase, partial [Cyclobacteriaceae bacterium]
GDFHSPKIHVIPEGGANGLGVMGAGEIIDEIDEPFDHIITSIGTGTTMAGLIARLAGRNNVLGLSSLKGEFIHTAFKSLLLTMNISHSNYTVNADYHFGGYGKTSPELIDFINKMKEEIEILFDPIYTGKALFGVWNMITNGKFDGQTLIFLHTGGLQGIAGHNQKSPQKIHI